MICQTISVLIFQKQVLYMLNKGNSEFLNFFFAF